MTNQTQTKTQSQKETLEAIIGHNGDEKYIVVRVENKKVLVSLPIEYHSGIASEYKSMVRKPIQVLGGGILTMNKESKTIKTYGKSGGFGKPNIKDVQAILTTNFPDYRIDVKVTDYIRG